MLGGKPIDRSEKFHKGRTSESRLLTTCVIMSVLLLHKNSSATIICQRRRTFAKEG